MKPTLRKRFGALLLDYVAILVWIAFITLISVVLFIVIGDGFPNYLHLFGPFVTQLIFFAVLTLPVGIYLYASESGPQHATLGKRKMGLKVINVDGNEVTKKQILLRTIIKLLPWEIAHAFVWQLQWSFDTQGVNASPPVWILIGLNFAMVLAFVYIITVIVRKDGRGPHDMIAHTMVIGSKE